MPLRIAYLTTSYPDVSHTFIRREIMELERRGHEVVRLALRKGRIVDPKDAVEAGKANLVLEQGKLDLIKSVAKVAGRKPRQFLKALGTTWAMNGKSERGIVRHMAYLVEACHVQEVMQNQGVEHLHVHFGTNCAAVARLASQLGDTTYSLTIHGPDEFDAVVGFSLGDKVEDSKFTVAITNYCSAQIRRWVPYEHWDKIKIVHCTVGDHILAEPEPIPEDSRTFVCVGRLSAQKGQLLLVDAMAKLKAEGVDAKLVLAGDGEMREVIEARIAAQGLEDRITVSGWIGGDQVQAFLRSSRALVLPSFAEGLPVVIMEAFAAARPVITTYIAGIPELVEDGVNGWLCVSGDIDGLVSAMREALETPVARLDEMGQEGRARVIAGHSTATEVDKLEGYFQDAIDARAR